MSKLEVGADISARLLAFVNSNIFKTRSLAAKSEYWRYHSTQLQANISGNSVEVSGDSGFYVPGKSSVLKRASQKMMRAIREPAKVAGWIRRVIGSRFEVPRLMSYQKAFDAVMSGADVSVPIVSRFTIDHRKLARHPNVFASTASIKRHYAKWSGYEVSASIVNHYYYQNILRSFINSGEIRTILEIGAGNGNFPSILYHDWQTVRVVLVDLPETLTVSIPFLSSMFPRSQNCATQ